MHGTEVPVCTNQRVLEKTERAAGSNHSCLQVAQAAKERIGCIVVNPSNFCNPFPVSPPPKISEQFIGSSKPFPIQTLQRARPV